MPVHPLRVAATDAGLARVLAAIPGELGLEREFPPAALAEAEAVAARSPLPKPDRTDIPFLTIDPPGSTDLDQALAIERDGAGWRVHYAIANLPAFVAPGGAVDAEARRRGATMYAADGRIPLHPVAISEDAASLLPGRTRGAYVWRLDLDGDGRVVDADVALARVRSRSRLSYEEADAELASGRGDHVAMLRLLREVGEARLALESERGGASLSIPEVLVTEAGGGYTLERRVLLPVERWNAQLSLMTGMEAARIMLAGRVGILRTMPAAEDEDYERFRRRAQALGEPWPRDERYGDYLRRLDGGNPRHLAILDAAASLFRGAGYTPFDGAPPPPEAALQAAIGAPYAHVTAPLRRLVDRFALVICAALVAGEDPPTWARAALPELPSIMARTANTAGRLDRATLDAVEAAVLASRVGEIFDAVVVSARDDSATIQLLDPAVEARCAGELEPGTTVRVRLTAADVAAATVRFEVVTGR